MSAAIEDAESFLIKKFGAFNKYHPANQLTEDFDIEDIINLLEEYASAKIKEATISGGEAVECPAGKFKHNESIFHLGQCHYCYGNKIL